MHYDLMYYYLWDRAKNFEKSGTYNNAWKKNDDGKLDQTDGPRVVVGDQSQVPQRGYITRCVVVC